MIDDYAEYLAAEAKSDIAALHQFKILYDPSREQLHLFFEGDDDSLFYMPEVRRRGGNGAVFPYVCNGKKNVVAVRDKIHDDGYRKAKCLYFVDRDLDDFLNEQVNGSPSTYVTDGYSIESDIISLTSLEMILDDVVRLSRADPEYRGITSRYELSRNSFSKAMMPVMAWVLASRESGNRPQLNQKIQQLIEMTDPVTFSRRKGGFKKFQRQAVGPDTTTPVSTVVRWCKIIANRDFKLWLRGKYELWSFQMFILKSLDRLNASRVEAGGRAIKIPASLKDARFFEILGGRVLLPQSLDTFLNSRIQ